jgi:hypothetical protein
MISKGRDGLHRLSGETALSYYPWYPSRLWNGLKNSDRNLRQEDRTRYLPVSPGPVRDNRHSPRLRILYTGRTYTGGR